MRAISDSISRLFCCKIGGWKPPWERGKTAEKTWWAESPRYRRNLDNEGKSWVEHHTYFELQIKSVDTIQHNYSTITTWHTVSASHYKLHKTRNYSPVYSSVQSPSLIMPYQIARMGGQSRESYTGVMSVAMSLRRAIIVSNTSGQFEAVSFSLRWVSREKFRNNVSQILRS